MLQPVLDFLLSFLKLSTNKILIGLLAIGLGASLTNNYFQTEKHEVERLADKEEKDSLRTAIVNLSVNCEVEKTLLHKEFYEKLAQDRENKNPKSQK